MYFWYPLFGLLVVVVVYTRTLEPSKRARNDTCKSHDKVMMYVNKEPLGGEWMIQIVDIDGDGSCLEAWCSLETVSPLFVPGAHSKLSWVSVDLTANRGNEMTGWKAWKPRLSILTVFPQHILNIFLYPLPRCLIFISKAHLLLFYQTPNVPR